MSRRAPALPLLLLLGSLLVTFPALAGNEFVDYIPNSSLDLGSGFALGERTVHPSALAPFTVREVSDGGQTVTYNLSMIDNTQDLAQELEVGVSGGYDGPTFSASGRAKFVGEHKLNTYAVNLVVHCKVLNATKRIADPGPQLGAQAQATLASDPQALPGGAFSKAYGDRYVSAITTGGEYIGLVSIETKTETDKAAVEAEMTASQAGVVASASLAAKMEKVSKSHKVTVYSYSQGGQGLALPSDVDSMLALVKSFPAAVLSHGAPLKVELSQYSDFPQYRTGADVSLETQIALEGLNLQYLDYLFLKNDLTYTSTNKADFDWSAPGTSFTNISGYVTKTQAQLDQLRVLGDHLMRGQIKPDDAAIVNFREVRDFERDLKLPYRRMTVTIDDQKLFPLVFVDGGDHDIWGNTPYIDMVATVSASTDQSKLLLTVNCDIKESGSNWTHFGLNKTVTLLDMNKVNPMLRIHAFAPVGGTLHNRFGWNDHDWHDYGGTGLLVSAHAKGDDWGDDDNKIGADPIKFNPVDISLESATELGDAARHTQPLLAARGPGLKARLTLPGNRSSSQAEREAGHKSWFKGVALRPKK